MISKRMSSPLAVLLAAMMVAVCAVGVVSLYSDGSEADPATPVSDEAGLADAVKDGSDVAAVVLTKDVTLTKTLNVAKDIVIDLNGKTLKMNATNVFVDEGTALAANSMISVVSGKTLTVLNGYITLEEKVNASANNGMNAYVVSNSGTVTLTGVTVNVNAVPEDGKAETSTTDATHAVSVKAFSGNITMNDGKLVLGNEKVGVVAEGTTVTYKDTVVSAKTDAQKVEAINNASGTVVVEGDLTVSSGPVTVKDGATVKLGGNLTVVGSSTTTPATTTGGTATTTAVGASLTVSGTLEVSGTVTVGKSDMGTGVIGNATLTVDGKLVVAKTLNVYAGRAAGESGTPAAVVNTIAGSGTVTVAGGTLAGTIGEYVKFVNSGTLAVSSGTTIASIENTGSVTFSKNVTVTTLTNKTASAKVVVSQGVTLTVGTLANAGTVTLMNGADPKLDGTTYTFGYTVLKGKIAGVQKEGSTTAASEYDYGTVVLGKYAVIKAGVSDIAGYVSFDGDFSYIASNVKSSDEQDMGVSGQTVSRVAAPGTSKVASTTATAVANYAALDFKAAGKVFLNGGDMTVSSGTLFVLKDDATFQSKTVTVDSGTTLTVSGALADNSSDDATVTLTVGALVVKGTVEVVKGTPLIYGDTATQDNKNVQGSHAVLKVENKLTVSGTLTVAGSTVTAATLVNSGTITVSGNAEVVKDKVTTAALAGKLEVTSTSDTPAVYNGGTITVGKNSSFTATTVDNYVKIEDDGKVVDVVGGTIAIDGTAFFAYKGVALGEKLSDVTVKASKASEITVTGTLGGTSDSKEFVAGGKATVSGTAYVSVFTVNADSATTVSGKLYVSGATVVNGTLDVSGTASFAVLTVGDDASVTVKSASVSGAVSIGHGAVLTVLRDGTLTATTDAITLASYVEASSATSPAKAAGRLVVDGALVLGDSNAISTSAGTGSTGLDVSEFALVEVAGKIYAEKVSQFQNVTLSVTGTVYSGSHAYGQETVWISTSADAVYKVSGAVSIAYDSSASTAISTMVVPAGTSVVAKLGSTLVLTKYDVAGSMTFDVPAVAKDADATSIGDVAVTGTVVIETVGTAKSTQEFKASVGTLDVKAGASAAVGKLALTVTTLKNLGSVSIEADGVLTATNTVNNSGDITVDGTLAVSGFTVYNSVDGATDAEKEIGTVHVNGTVKFTGTSIDTVLANTDYVFGAYGAVVYDGKAIAGPQHVVPKTSAGAAEYTVAIAVSAGTSVKYLVFEGGDAVYSNLSGTFVGFDGNVVFNENVTFGNYKVIIKGDTVVKAGAEVTFTNTLYNVGTMTLEAKIPAPTTSTSYKVAKISGTGTDYASTLYNLGTIVMEDSSCIQVKFINNGYYFEAADGADVEDIAFNGVIVKKSGNISAIEGGAYINTYGTIEIFTYDGFLAAAKFVNNSVPDEMKQYAVGKVVLMEDLVISTTPSDIVGATIPVDLDGHTITIKAGYKDEYGRTVPSVEVKGLYVKSGDNAARFASISTYAYDPEKSYSDVVVSAGSISVTGDIAGNNFTVADVEGTLDLTGASFHKDTAISVSGADNKNAVVEFGDLVDIASVALSNGKSISAVFGNISKDEATAATVITGTGNVTIDGAAELGSVTAKNLVIGEGADVTVGTATSTESVTSNDLYVKGKLTVFGNINSTSAVGDKFIVDDGASFTAKKAGSLGSIVFNDVKIAGDAKLDGNIVATAGSVAINGSVVVGGENGISAKTLTVTGDLQTKKITVSADGKFIVKSGANVTGVKDNKGVVTAAPSITVAGDASIDGTVDLSYVEGDVVKYGSLIVGTTYSATDLTVGADGILAVGGLTVYGDLVNKGKISASGVISVHGAFYNLGKILFLTVGESTGSLTVVDMYADAPIDYEITVSGRLFAVEALDLSKVTFTAGYGTFLFDVPAVSSAIDGAFSVVYVAVGKYLNVEGDTLVPADNAGYFKNWTIAGPNVAETNSTKYPTSPIGVSSGEGSMSWTITAVFNNQFGEQTWFDVTVDLEGKDAIIDLGDLEPGYTFTTTGKNVFLAVVFYDIDGNVIASDNLVVYSVNGAPSIGNRNVVTCEYLTDGNGYGYGGNTAAPYAVTVQMYYWAATGNDAYHLITLGYDMDATEFSVTLNYDVDDETESETSWYMYKETVEYPTAEFLNSENPGFTFLHWSLTPGGEAVEPVAVMDGKDYTYYAVYEAETNTVTFDFDGHGLTDFKVFQVLSGQTLDAEDLAEVAELASDEHYTFIGWFTETGEPADLNAKVYSDTTFYAKWEPKEYTVTFMDGETVVGTENIPYNETAEFYAAPAKENYVFQYWAVDGTKYDFATPVTGDLTLYTVYNGVELDIEIDIAVGAEYGTLGAAAETVPYGSVLRLSDDRTTIVYTDFRGNEVTVVTAVPNPQDNYRYIVSEDRPWLGDEGNVLAFPLTVVSEIYLGVVFEKKDIPFEVEVNGENMSSDAPTEINKGEDLTVNISAATGYHIVGVTVNGVPLTFDVTQNTPTTYTVTVEDVQENVKINVTTQLSVFIVNVKVSPASLNPDNMGKIEGDNVIDVPYDGKIIVNGATITFGDDFSATAVANENFKFVKWIDAAGHDVEDGDVTISVGTAFYAVFEPITTA